jgi:hypothetical protein
MSAFRYFVMLSTALLCMGLKHCLAQPVEYASPETMAAYDRLFAGMDADRQKLRNGHAIITGTAATKFSKNLEPVIGDYRVVTAFDHDRERWRFDIDRPGDVIDYSKIATDSQNHSTGLMKTGNQRKRYALNGKMGTYWDGNNSICVSAKSDDTKTVSHESYDVRALGLYYPISWARHESYSQVMSYWKSMRRLPNMTQKNQMMIIVWNGANPEGGKYRTTMHIDVENGMTPVYLMSEKRDKPLPNEWLVEHEYKVSWKKINDVYVPTEFHLYYIGRSYDSAGPKHFTDTIDAKIEWKNVNNLRGDSLFNYTTFGLPDHVGIAEVTNAGMKYTRQPKQNPEQLAQQQMEVYTAPQESSWRNYLGLGVAGFGLLIIIVTVWRSWRKARFAKNV